jgi:serine phosphatase RsbU (regulator of sigma subunit)
MFLFPTGPSSTKRKISYRRFAQEMEIARQVQARLFPQKLPAMRTLEYTGGCIQARKVGGDYYDFLELCPGRLAMVLADIASKGVSGALLMANLQANLRSQYALAVDDLPRLLASVNRLFYENSGDASYATLLFADYDDSSRKLRYELWTSSPAPAARQRKLAGSGLRDAEGGVAEFHLHRDGIV